MIPVLLAILNPQVQTVTETAADYFCLTPGVTRFYSSTIGGAKTDTTDVVGSPALIGTEEMIPITTKLKGVDAQKFYYQVKDGDVLIVADWDRKKIEPPIPVLRIGDAETQWNWSSEGTTFYYTSKKGKTRNVFGKDLPTVEFKATGSDGEDALSHQVVQTAVYAKGVGMIEMTEVTSTKKSKSTRVIKLTKITGGGW